MSWITVDLNELDKATESFGKSDGLPEPGVYLARIDELYLDKTQSGAVFFSLVATAGESPNDTEIRIQGWDVVRMVKNKDGNTKNSNGGYFTGVILLNKMAKCIGKDVASLVPTKKLVEIFGQQKEVYSLNDLVGKKVILGIRHKKYEKQDGSEGVKLDLVDVCCENDSECQEKLKKRIEKRQVIEDKGNKQQSNNNQTTQHSEIPDI